VYDVKTIERHIHQLLRGGPIQEHTNGGDQLGAVGDEREAAPHFHAHVQAQAEPSIPATATRRTMSNARHEEEEEDNEDDRHTTAELGSAPESRDESGHAGTVNGTARGNGARAPRSRRRERRNSNTPAATGRPRSDSGKAPNGTTGGRGMNGAPADNSVAAAAGDRDGRKPKAPLQKQGRSEKPASKFRQGQRGANGTTAPTTTHRRLPPPEALGLTPAASNGPSATTPTEVEEITNGIHTMGKHQTLAGKQQWVAKAPAKSAQSLDEVDVDAQPTASTPAVAVVQPPRPKAPKVALEREKRAKIAKDMVLVFESLRPSEQEMQAKLDVIKRLQRIVGTLWPGMHRRPCTHTPYYASHCIFPYTRTQATKRSSICLDRRPTVSA
jgi:hypothetical protein